MISTSVLLFAGVILLGVLVVLAALAVILIIQNRNEDAGMRPPSPPPQSYQPFSSTPEQNYDSGQDLSASVGISGSSNPQWLESVRQLVQSGQKIEAIKIFRQHTGMGLKESKDAVEALAAGLGVTTTIRSTQSSQLSPEASSQVMQLLRDNRKIEAIKLIREQTGLGLKEAKDIADALEKYQAGGIRPS